VDKRPHEVNGISRAFPNIPTHETERLILREVRAEQQRFLALKAPVNQAQIFLNIKNDEDWQHERNKAKLGLRTWNTSSCWFMLFDKASGSPIGSCGFHNWFLIHRRAELGYVLIEERWKRLGLMSEALKFVIPFGFNQLNLIRMEACISPENKASLSIIEKFGFQQEGLLRQHYTPKGSNSPEDSILFSLLESDYRVRKNMLG
jgi:ribosomal-protein-alanine N-acetyltransferase